MTPPRRTQLLSLLALAVAIPAIVAAGTDPIKARQDTMEGVGGAMKALSGIARGEAKFDATTVQAKAKEIAAAFDAAAELFPAGSDQGASETWAKPGIWTNRADFDGKLQAAHAAALDLQKVTDEAAYRPALGKLGAACKACHESYRRPKD